MTAALLLALSLPCVYWTQGVESRAMLEAAAIRRICVPPERADSWRAAGFTAIALTDGGPCLARSAAFAGHDAARRGWRRRRAARGLSRTAGASRDIRAAKYVYDVPAGKAALAAAEVFAYGADAVLKIDPADLGDLGRMLTFLEALPPVDLPTVSDLAVVDDGSAVTGEVMNLLARRNLLFEVVQAPSSRFPINIRIGTPEYPREEAADPSAFAQKIRRQLTDEQRGLRVYGSEVVICRLTAMPGRARLHLINYGGREIEGLRIRVRGTYGDGEVHVAGAGRLALEDHIVSGGATEFTIPRIATYAVVDLRTER